METSSRGGGGGRGFGNGGFGTSLFGTSGLPTTSAAWTSGLPATSAAWSAHGRTALNQGRDALHGMHQRVQEGLERSGYRDLGAQLHHFVKDRAHLDINALRDAGYGMADNFGPRWELAKREGQKKLFDLGAPARAKVMFGLLCVTKAAATADPDMCNCVRRRLHDLIDVFWNDLTVWTEQMFEDQRNLALGKVAETAEELGKLGEPPATCGLKWVRAKVLYHFLPYDISIFGQLKDPVWWILTVVSLIPLYGIRVMFYSVLLVLIAAGCPADEFQLVSYIIGFKGSQFISSGLIQACIAAIKYYMCVHPGGTHTCDTEGPGANQDLVSGLVDFIGSIVLTWVAFMLLPYSTRSAGMREAVERSQEDSSEVVEEGTGCCGSTSYDPEKGGRLRGLLGYDVVCFLLSCALCAFLTYVDSAHLRPGGRAATDSGAEQMLEDANTWEGHTAIFWARVFYAFLSFPFVVFLIPGLNSILTHTTATGYNANGLCVPFMLYPMPEDKNK